MSLRAFIKISTLFFAVCCISFPSLSQFNNERDARIYYEKYLTKKAFEYCNEYNKLEDICKSILPQGKYGKIVKIQDCVWRKEQEILKQKNLTYIFYNVAYDRYSLLHNLAKQTGINVINDSKNYLNYIRDYMNKRKQIIIDSIKNSFKNALLNEVKFGDVSQLLTKNKQSSNTVPFEKKCTELGFTRGTEGHGNCVLKLME